MTEYEAIIEAMNGLIIENIDFQTGEPCCNPCVDCQNRTVERCIGIVKTYANPVQKKKTAFAATLEEACRQWCDFIDDTPERKTGEGFADFFYEILTGADWRTNFEN